MYTKANDHQNLFSLQVCRIAHGSMYMTVGYGGLGVENADFILFVSTTHEERCVVGSAVAYAAYCQLEGALDRYAQTSHKLACSAMSHGF